MNIGRMHEIRENRVLNLYEKVFRKPTGSRGYRTPFEVQEIAIGLLEEYTKSHTIRCRPRVRELTGNDDLPTLGVCASGGASTADYNMRIINRLKTMGMELYGRVVGISNRSYHYEKRRLQSVCENNGNDYVEFDFWKWAKEEFNFKNPIAETRFFYPEGSENIPPI